MTTIEAKPIDRLSRLSIKQVTERTGWGRTTIFRRLAEDKMNCTPGKSFPLPARNSANRRALEWSEIDLVRWMESRK